ncbi:hypothetical protein A3C96_04215 [Candidatus Uhrbacteria bacterium RIFCSPHIGHO2_02_FULL_60_10]|uniref:HTH arsR-type domain-containing protein n=1 Tax=Candidatus Uhrbacteria bacterium RIFCSPHIGHO2_02_FULL_60_10 TaxID=1802392 RepID=A0A1F7U8Q5_9BACT|nr:MAG: hypothetical protein A3C96_04215 [Candidatus Uhrbacteria bacterium RIFCSPHIGHO2_02_FULL_60_10]
MSDAELRSLKKKVGAAPVIAFFRMVRAACGSSRLRILYLLKQTGSAGLTITDLSKLLGASLSRISHQMRILKKHGLVSAEKDGRNVAYRLVGAKASEFLKMPK